MLKNKHVIDILFVAGWISFAADAYLLIMMLRAGSMYFMYVMYFVYVFVLGCIIFMTRSFMEMAETQKKRNEIFLEIAKKLENRV